MKNFILNNRQLYSYFPRIIFTLSLIFCVIPTTYLTAEEPPTPFLSLDCSGSVFIPDELLSTHIGIESSVGNVITVQLTWDYYAWFESTTTQNILSPGISYILKGRSYLAHWDNFLFFRYKSGYSFVNEIHALDVKYIYSSLNHTRETKDWTETQSGLSFGYRYSRFFTHFSSFQEVAFFTHFTVDLQNFLPMPETDFGFETRNDLNGLLPAFIIGFRWVNLAAEIQYFLDEYKQINVVFSYVLPLHLFL